MRAVFGRMMVLGLASMAAACVPKPAPEPEPVPTPQPVTRPSPTPPPAPVRDWADRALTPGDWTYVADAAGARAAFGGQAESAPFVMRCDRAGRRILLLRQGAASGGTMSVQTSYGVRTLPLQGDRSGYAAASLAATDPLLDQIAFSRGRFSIDVPGQAQLMLPAWPETARVVEDCRA
ncbi:hypothetical protein E2493_07630 [Sphingomonas parva]|uniref:Lipoprotein n=1 Tax=Sphingomonas parva TaxID=2555898 RepID=A0A4Y8ZSC8_9SPHN|nr:hypothetical protein [Sphingomonas parva]TFI58921.1 hypothetical protein E2493_07630 [Sphingomonas parva]